jgi:hypothetical protein
MLIGGVGVIDNELYPFDALCCGWRIEALLLLDEEATW